MPQVVRVLHPDLDLSRLRVAVWCGLASRSWSCRRRMRRISRNDFESSGFGLRELPFRSTDHPSKHFGGYPKAVLNMLSTVEGEEYHRVGMLNLLTGSTTGPT